MTHPITRLTGLASGLVFTLFALAGCGSLGDPKEVDYQSAVKKETPLEVPPDLIKPSMDDRFAIPASGSASRREFDRQQGTQRGITASSAVLPKPEGMSIERYNDQRVLVVDQPAEKLWPVLRQFWLDNGFAIATENPETGLIETDWAENRAKLPRDFIRRSLGSLLDGLYDTGERDRFRMRLERRSATQSEITVAHRGLVEVYAPGTSQTRTAWTNRPSDRQLEEDFLRRMMLRLGADEGRVKELMAKPGMTGPVAQLSKTETNSQVEINEPYERAWRRLGVAIDRLGFTVEDRDRAKGLLYVRYRDPTVQTGEQPGFFGRIFSSTKPDEAIQYRLRLTGQGEKSTLIVMSKDDKQSNDANAQRMLSVIFEQLK